jgi:5-enolpyruvylshikimate-3-phosphate synthase
MGVETRKKEDVFRIEGNQRFTGRGMFGDARNAMINLVHAA